jgi:HD-GYP domain-containing protein (c-di-GMP phosphodiesterase class II)
LTKIIAKQKIRYLSVNKKAFQVNDKLNFELFVKKENKMNLYSGIEHIVTKPNVRDFGKIEKIFIDSTGVDAYKKFINLKIDRLKRKTIAIANDTKASELQKNTPQDRPHYLSINKKSFQVDDRLSFELFVKNYNKINLFSKIGHIIKRDDKRYFEEIDKIFIKSTDVSSYKEFMTIKHEKLKTQERNNNIEFIVSNIKNNLIDIYTGSNSPNNIKKLYPLATNLTKLIIRKNLKLKNLIDMISKDYHTATHSLNVSIYAAVLGRALGLSSNDLNDLILSGMLHDIGKTELPDKILNKPTILNEHEFKEIKKHPTLGFMLARKSGIINQKILSGIHHHHERLDGSGYPNGFKNDHVSQFARIIGICDAYDAMSTNRVFKGSEKTFDALIEMKRSMKGQMDNELIDVFIKVLTS